MKLIKTKLQNGMGFWYRSDDKFIGKRIALQKYEEYESILILKYINKNSVVVDVGANIGYYTLLLAKICKKVYAFEPDKECFEILVKNIKENKLTNVVLFNMAVSDKKEKVIFFHNNINFGDNRIQSPSASPYPPLTRGKNTVLSVNLDEFLKNEKQIDLIKIDVQGYEEKVINGAKNLIKKYSPVLFYEYNGGDLKFLRQQYKYIFLIDYWYYFLRRGIDVDKKTGYADLLMTNKKIKLWEQYKNIEIKKVIKAIINYVKDKISSST